MTPTTLTVPEGDSRTYTVVLESEPSDTVTVTPRVEGNSEVTVSPAALTFTATTWETGQEVTVAADEDADAEQDAATVKHTVAGGDYASETAADVAVTVNDNDTASTAVKLTVDPSTVNEAAGATSVTVTGTLNHAPNTAATEVTVSVSGATASASDFAVVAGFTLTIDSGATTGTATFMLTPDDDGVDEDDETVTVGGTAGSLTVTAAELSITDDDTRGITVDPTELAVTEGSSNTYTVVLESEPSDTVTVTPRVEGNSDVTVSPAALTFTATTWETEQEVTVEADEDDDAEQDAATVKHTVTGGDYASETAADVAVTVNDNDTASTAVKLTVDPSTVNEDAGATSVTVTGALNHAPNTAATEVTVTVGASGDAALEGTDYSTVDDITLTIGSGATTGTATFMLTPDNDGVDEDDETLTVGGTAGSLTVNAAS